MNENIRVRNWGKIVAVVRSMHTSGNNHIQVHVLALSNRGIVLNAARDFATGNVAGQDRQDERTVGHQNLLTGSDRLGKRGIRASQLFVGSLETVVRSEDNSLSLGQVNLLAFGKKAGTNLGSLGIKEDGCGGLIQQRQHNTTQER